MSVTSIEQAVGQIPPRLASILTDEPLTTRELLLARHQSLPINLHQEAAARQATELWDILRTADRIEGLFAQKGYSLPTIYALHTAGLPPPFAGDLLGFYTRSAPFELFPPTDIHGHEGSISVAKIDDEHTYLAFSGRAHPYEWQTTPDGQRVISLQIKVIKELIRRQRLKRENPVVILSYLSGVLEGSPLKPGDIGIILDDTNLGPTIHPGMGFQGYTERYLGARFQAKAGRYNLDLARAFCEEAENLGVRTGPVAIVGTPGETEYQSFFEMGLAKAAFKEALQMGFERFAGSIYPDYRNQGFRRKIYSRRLHTPSLLFGMGNTFELALFRQTQTVPDPLNEYVYHESDIPVLALALITDEVGKGSLVANHPAIVAKAFSTASRNANLLGSFAKRLANRQIDLAHPRRLPDGMGGEHLKGQILKAVHDEAMKLQHDKDISEKSSIISLRDVQNLFRLLVQSENKLIQLYNACGYYDQSTLHHHQLNIINEAADSLNGEGNGQTAYEYLLSRLKHLLNYIGLRNLGQHKYDKVPIRELLAEAQMLAQAARVVASEKNLKNNYIPLPSI